MSETCPKCGAAESWIIGSVTRYRCGSEALGGKYDTFRPSCACRLSELEAEVRRLREIIKECRKSMRELDPGSHAEQSWEDYCKDTLKLTGEET